MNRTSLVKNRAPAAIQITAEQLLREAKERGLEEVEKAPTQYITDKEELLQYQAAKRKDFEDQLRRNRQHFGVWCRYALWEASLNEFERSRSIFERAIDVDYRNQTMWLKYAEMEMKGKFINHARNIWDRCVTLHPRMDVFWYKYTYMEEMIGAPDTARQIFERWMQWEPDDQAWGAYIKFEMRQGDIVRSRLLHERYTESHPTSRAYLKYARWEEKQHEFALARSIYERSLVELHPDERSEQLLIQFARFEERSKEYDRARVIYKYALEHIAKAEDLTDLNKEYIAFEKRHGERRGIEEAILGRRRDEYEERLRLNSFDYDTWFDYIRIEESEGMDIEKTRDVFERAIANVPPVQEKRYWRRYIYLWITYALFEELHAKDIDRTRAVYKACLGLIPHKVFTFGKVWVMAAHLEVRNKDLTAARKIFGQGVGLCGKESIFKKYIELELQLGEVERCRLIYAKYVETMPHNVTAWKAFAQLEQNVGETARARGLYELAVTQPVLDMPELLWKAYIEFEISEQESARVRLLYERLLERTSHVKVWTSFGQYEVGEATEAISAVQGSDEESSSSASSDSASPRSVAAAAVDRARGVFSRGYDVLKQQGLKEERVVLLEAWRSAESSFGSFGDVSTVEKKLPRKIKMRRMVTAPDGSELGLEEYYDYNFPDDEKKVAGLKILENAMKWKAAAAERARAAEAAANGEDGDEEEEEGQGFQREELDESDGDGMGIGSAIESGGSMLGKRKGVEEEIDIEDI